MKKCPECGNPSYDGAPICGNCGYKFPKPKVKVTKEESIFEKPKTDKDSDSKSTMEIIKEKKLLIGAILLITLIVICGIFLTSPGDKGTTSNSPLPSVDGLVEFTNGNFAFKYPDTWKKMNLTDSEREGAVFFKNSNNTVIEYYNVTSDSDNLKDITQKRINYAQENGAYVELVETITMDGRNTSNIILENADGNYTRFVSMMDDANLHVFKITGESVNSVTSDDITSMLNTADIA